jgi:hypothetical protein
LEEDEDVDDANKELDADDLGTFAEAKTDCQKKREFEFHDGKKQPIQTKNISVDGKSCIL